jgi:hypothetical protein
MRTNVITSFKNLKEPYLTDMNFAYSLILLQLSSVFLHGALGLTQCALSHLDSPPVSTVTHVVHPCCTNT